MQPIQHPSANDVLGAPQGVPHDLVRPLPITRFRFERAGPAGRAHQLELKSGAYRRDGELRPGGWLLQTIRFIHGPFARVGSGA